MNSYRFSDVIFVKIRLIFVLYNADADTRAPLLSYEKPLLESPLRYAYRLPARFLLKPF